MGIFKKAAKDAAYELADAVIPLDRIADGRRIRRERRDFERAAKTPGTAANKLTKRWAALDAMDDIRRGRR